MLPALYFLGLLLTTPYVSVDPPAAAWIRQWQVIAVVSMPPSTPKPSLFVCEAEAAGYPHDGELTFTVEKEFKGAPVATSLSVLCPSPGDAGRYLLFARPHCGKLIGVARRIERSLHSSRPPSTAAISNAQDVVLWWAQGRDVEIPFSEAAEQISAALNPRPR